MIIKRNRSYQTLLFVFLFGITNYTLPKEGVNYYRKIKLKDDVKWKNIVLLTQAPLIGGIMKHSFILYDPRTFVEKLSLPYTASISSNEGKLLLFSRQNKNNCNLILWSDKFKKLNAKKFVSNKLMIDTRYYNNCFWELAINLDDYVLGKTNNSINGEINNLSENKKIMISHIQKPPPLRISLPTFDINKNIYVAFDDTYNIDVYSELGNKLFSFGIKNFQNIPISKEEYNYLSDFEKSVAIPEVTLPKLLKRIQAFANMILIIREPRPGSNLIFIDFFDKGGQKLKTNKYRIDEMQKLVDVYILGNNLYALTNDDNKNTYYLYYFKL